MAKGLKTIEVMCKQCKCKISAYINNKYSNLDIMSSVKDGVDDYIDNCKHHKEVK